MPIAGIQDRRDMDQALNAAKAFEPMDEAAVAERLGRSRPCAPEGKCELFEAGATFDGTANTNGR